MIWQRDAVAPLACPLLWQTLTPNEVNRARWRRRVSLIFWPHFCTIGRSGVASSIFLIQSVCRTISAKLHIGIRGCPSGPAGRPLCCCSVFPPALPGPQTLRRFGPAQQQPVHPESKTRKRLNLLTYSYNTSIKESMDWVLRYNLKYDNPRQLN